MADHDVFEDFFAQITQLPYSWDGRAYPVPAFFQESSAASAAFLTPIDRVRARLPAAVRPVRVTPWHALTCVTVFEHREADLGRYSQVGIGFPVSFAGTGPAGRVARSLALDGPFFVSRILVSTDLARDLAAEAGYPAARVDVRVERSSFGLVCRASEGAQHILTFEVKGLHPEPSLRRRRIEPLTVKSDRLLRSSAVWRLRTYAATSRAHAVHLQLGEHDLADDLIELGMTRPLRTEFAPYVQGVVSGAVESQPTSAAAARDVIELDARQDVRV